jgi:acetyl esterase/lipase
LFVGGDSVGGNLAAGLALYNLQRRGPSLTGQFLIYPTLAPEPQPPAATTEARAPMLSLDEVHALYRVYYGDTLPRSDPFAFPLVAADLAGLAPALLLPVEHDPLRDDAFAYHRRMLLAGVDSRLQLGCGLVHGCLRALGTSPGVEGLTGTLCDWLSSKADAQMQIRPSAVTSGERRRKHKRPMS